jgi:hypothetical protein
MEVLLDTSVPWPDDQQPCTCGASSVSIGMSQIA